MAVLLRRDLLCVKTVGRTLRVLTNVGSVNLHYPQSLQGRLRSNWKCKGSLPLIRLTHDAKQESKVPKSMEKSPEQGSPQQESLIMKVLMEESKAPATTIEKVAQAGKDLSYIAIIVACVAVTGVIAYTVLYELFSSNRPNAIHNKTLKLLLANEEAVDILGLPIKSKGETTRGGRSRHVRHFEFERNDRQFMRMVIHVSGSRRKGTVQVELEKDDNGKYQYRYVMLQSKDYPKRVVVLVDKRNELPAGSDLAED
uniref:Mitochondrial import inner membrane translocase subunit Tim21 n=1 Tax=Trichuris muris TaxID=70415 RepID=A0A5S6R3N2_TRIMR